MKKTGIILLALALTILAGCGRNLVKKNDTTNRANQQDTATSEVVSVSAPANAEFSVDSNKYVIDEDILTGIGTVNMDMYRAVYDAVDRHEASCDLSKFSPTPEDVDALQKAIGDRMNYEFFYYRESVYHSDTMKLEFIYFFPDNEIVEMKETLAQKTQYIISNVLNANATPLQNEIALYLYITGMTVYDVETFKTGEGNTNMYEVLVNHKGICYSYANTLKYFLNIGGIEAHIARSAGHAWNIVKIDGEYYHLDATAARPTSPSLINFSDADLTTYYSFTSSDIWVGNPNYSKLPAPVCSSTRFDYLRYFGAYALSDDTLYYANPDDEYRLYATDINTNGAAMQKISDIKPYLIIIHEGWLYYADTESDLSLNRIKVGGSGKELLDTSVSAEKMWLEGDTLYYGASFAETKQYNTAAS